MGKTKLFFYDTPLNKYSVTALLGALETRAGLLETLEVGFFCKPEELTEREDFSSDDTVILAFSFFTSQIWEMHDMLSALAPLRESCRMFTLAGGPHATGDAERTVTVIGFDYALAGEGEELFPDTVEALRDGRDPTGLPGLTGYDNNGALIRGGQAARVEIENYSPDARSFRRYGPIEITRGCPYGCSFCQTGNLMGRRVRHRSVETIRAVIERAKKDFPVRFFRALTPNALSFGSKDGVTTELGEVERLLVMLRETLGEDGKIYMGYFPSEVRPNHITEESVALLRRFVCNENIVIGAQTGSERILKAAHRGHTVDDVYRAVEILHRGGFIADVDFIFGMPGEEAEDIALSVQMIEHLADMGAKVNVHTFMPLPQTPWEMCDYGTVPAEAKELIRRLGTKGVVYGDWAHQAELAKRIHLYYKTGKL